MKNLVEYMWSFGDGMLKQYNVFGSRKVAEGLVSWSESKSPGTELKKKTGWGLHMTVIANGPNPRVLLQLNRQELYKFLSALGPVTMLALCEYGFCLAGPGKADKQEPHLGCHLPVVIYIPGQDNGAQAVLYRYEPAGSIDEEPQEPIPLGAIDLGEHGFMLLEPEDLKEELAELKSKDSGGLTLSFSAADYE